MNLQKHLCPSLLAVLAAYALCFSLAQAETLSGRVVKIADGDTVTILDEANHQHKVRLVGIDAPERKQPFGTVSRQHLAGLVFGKTVAVKWQKRDRYQRILGKVLVDGQDVNLEQIKAGLAWHYKQYGKAQQLADLSLYGEAEEFARVNGMGLWRDPASVAPWDFRREKRALPAADEASESALARAGQKTEPGCGAFLDVLRTPLIDPKLTHLARLLEGTRDRRKVGIVILAVNRQILGRDFG
ncbi:MAG: nuclease (SNase-like) [Nitrosospira multiformis]|jgi:endonuclease YncB( thermonuclease family)|nr:nuclease (SNase-like) [Nitrosospira multiformis]